MFKLLSAVLAALIVASPAMADPASPEGNWSRGDGKARVVIQSCGSDLCAINTWIRPGVTDEHVGDRLVMTVAAKGGKWTGQAYDPQRKLSYRLTITVSGDSMTTSGCVFGVLCKTMGWTRL